VSDDFEQDVQHCRNELNAAREELLAVVRSLQDHHLERGRRGGWDVRRVLEHVIYSEFMYARIVQHLRGLPVDQGPVDAVPASAADAVDKLAASRTALTEALGGVDEETFYRIGRLGHEEYSVLSLLENEINHEREHAAQIMATVAASP
jgi:uncharacterized damage-inducible protein DinB